MATNERPEFPPQLRHDANWDACYDITLRRFFYSSLAGTAAALFFFRRPATRWAAVAFGAGAGVGSAYTDCSHILDGQLPKWPLPSRSLVPPLPALSAPPLMPEE